MNSESNIQEDPKDFTKWIWLGVVVLFCVMLGMLWQFGGLSPSKSMVRARHILISFTGTDPADQARALELIQGLRQRILDGEDFGDLAEQYSNDPLSARRRGDLNWAVRGAYADAFDHYVWSAPIGEVSEIVTTVHGYHLIVVENRIISDVERVLMEKDKRAIEMTPGTRSTP